MEKRDGETATEKGLISLRLNSPSTCVRTGNANQMMYASIRRSLTRWDVRCARRPKVVISMWPVSMRSNHQKATPQSK